MDGYIDAPLSWKVIPGIHSCVPGPPLVLKGVPISADALIAMDAGADAIDCIEPRGKKPGYLLIREYSCLGLLEPRKNCPQVFDEMEDASTGVSGVAQIYPRSTLR